MKSQTNVKDPALGPTDAPSGEPEVPPTLPSIPSALGSLVLGLAAWGWVALWFVDRGECEREGVILTCDSGQLETEINLVWSGVLVIVGLLAIVRGVVGLVLRIKDAMAPGGPSPRPTGPPPVGPPAAPVGPPAAPIAQPPPPTVPHGRTPLPPPTGQAPPTP